MLAGVFAKGSDHMISNDPEERGRQLHAALEDAYQKLAATGTLSGRGTDITAIVLPYFPPDITFDDAETTLRNAGFSLGPRPDLNAPPNPNRAKDWYAVVARISPFAQQFPSRTDLYISLLPKTPGDYTTVSRVSATFFVSRP
jgi:hypothetical protein